MFIDNYKIKKIIKLSMKKFKILKKYFKEDNDNNREESEIFEIAKEQLVKELKPLMLGMSLKEVISTWYTLLNEIECETMLSFKTPIEAIVFSVKALAPYEKYISINLKCDNLADEIETFTKEVKKQRVKYPRDLTLNFDGLLLLFYYLNKTDWNGYQENREKLFSYVQKRAKYYDVNIFRLGVLDE
jgi:hypothetical protein